MLSITIVRIIFALNVFSNVGDYQRSNIFTILVQIVAMGIIPLFLYLIYLKTIKIKKPVKTTLENFGFLKAVNRNDWIKIIIISIISTYVVVCFSSIWQVMLSFIGYNRGVYSSGSIVSIKVLLLELVFTATLPAFFEEFVNRGLLYRGYVNSKPKFKVVIITAIMFALMHQNITQVGYTFVCGLIAGTMVFYTKSIYPAIVYHFINNAISVLRQYGRGGGNIFNYLNIFYEVVFKSPIISFFLFIIAIIIIIGLLLTLSEKRGKKYCYKVLDTTIYAESNFDCSPYLNIKLKKPTIMDNLFLYATLILNSVVTIMTLIFGLLL